MELYQSNAEKKTVTQEEPSNSLTAK